MGVLIPAEITDGRSFSKRGMEAGDLVEGGYTVDTELRGLIEYCRERLYLNELGATFLTGLRGNVEWPRQINELGATWVEEEGACTQTTLNFGNLTMSPKRVVASTCYSLQIVRQSSLDVEALNRQEIAWAIAKAIDRAAMFGAGGLAPLGLLNETGLSAFTFAGPPTWESIVNFCAEMECCFCADQRNVRFASTPAVKAAWKSTTRADGQGGFILESEGGMYRADDKPFHSLCLDAASNAVLADRVVLGDFSQLLVGLWGGVDLVVDPYTNACNGVVNVTANAFADTAVRQPCAFVVSTDAGNQ